MASQHKNAIRIIIVAGFLDVLGAISFSIVEHISLASSLYWSITTATTVGYGDVIPRTTLGHVIAVLVMLTVIPLFAATFSLITSGLTATHVTKESDKVRKRLDHIIKHHPDIPDFEG